MKYLLIAVFVAASAFSAAADASSFGPHCGPDELYAAVESSREPPSGGHPDWLSEVFEHVINPEFHQPSNQKE